MDHAVKAMSARGPLARLLARRRFESAELEELYARYACKLQRTSVGSALALWAMLAASLAAVDATRGWRRAPQVFYYYILNIRLPFSNYIISDWDQLNIKLVYIFYNQNFY